MSDPRISDQHGATPWGRPEPQVARQPFPDVLGSPAHPQSQYPEQSAPDLRSGPQPGVPDDAYPPPRRRQPRRPLPEPPAGLAVGAMVAASCLLFVELAELAILLVTGGRGEFGGGSGGGAGFDPNSGTVTGLFGFAAFLAACFWLRASRRFAEAANPAARFAYGPAWTWFGWWVPVAFFWVPFGVVRDIREALAPDGGRRVGLGLWWTFWLLFGLRLYSLVPGDILPGDGEVLARSVAAVALTVAFIHWIRIIREITRAQEKAAGFA